VASSAPGRESPESTIEPTVESYVASRTTLNDRRGRDHRVRLRPCGGGRLPVAGGAAVGAAFTTADSKRHHQGPSTAT
jgi:hypothetical protein